MFNQIGFLLVLTLALLCPAFASAANFSEITATTEELLIAVSVDAQSLHFPTAHSGALHVPADQPSEDGKIIVTNSGTVSADFVINGSDAHNTDSSRTWALSDTSVGPSQFMHEVSTDNGVSNIALSSSFKGLAADVTPSSSVAMTNYQSKPVSGESEGESFSWGLVVMAVESL